MTIVERYLIVLLWATWCILAHSDSYQYEPPNYQYEPYVPENHAPPETQTPPLLQTTVATPAPTTPPPPPPTTTPLTTTPLRTTATPPASAIVTTGASGTELNYKMSTLAVTAQVNTDGSKFQGYIPLAGFNGQAEGKGAPAAGGEAAPQPLPPPPPSQVGQSHGGPVATVDQPGLSQTGDGPVTVSAPIAIPPPNPPPTPPQPVDTYHQVGTDNASHNTEHHESYSIPTSVAPPIDAPAPPAPEVSHKTDSVETQAPPAPPAPEPAETAQPPPNASPKPGYVFPSMIDYGSINGPPELPKFVLEPQNGKQKPQKVRPGTDYGFPPSPRTTPVPEPVQTTPMPTPTPTKPPPPPDSTAVATAKPAKPCKKGRRKTTTKGPCKKQGTTTLTPLPPETAPPRPPLPVKTPCPRSQSTTVVPGENPAKAVKPPCPRSLHKHPRVIDDVMLMPDNKPMTGACEDAFEKCTEWAQAGECETNPFWMKPNCQKACKTCGMQIGDVDKPLPKSDDCKNDHELCQFWMKVGECERNEPYMARHCPLSCGFC